MNTTLAFPGSLAYTISSEASMPMVRTYYLENIAIGMERRYNVDSSVTSCLKVFATSFAAHHWQKAHYLTRNLTLRLSPNTLSAEHFCVFTAFNRYTNFPSPKRYEVAIMRFKRQISGEATRGLSVIWWRCLSPDVSKGGECERNESSNEARNIAVYPTKVS